MAFLPLVENECVKLLRRRRFLIVMVILTVLLSVISYSRYRMLERKKDRDWRVEVQQQVASYQNMLRRQEINPSWARSLRAEVVRLQFHLDRGIDPEQPTAPFFTRAFANIAGILLLPLLVSVLGSDIVSAEHAEGTDKLLLTRGRKRWKVLLAKVVALFIFVTLTLACGGLLAYGISSIVLEPRGWEAPMFTGFRIAGAEIDVQSVRQIPLWQDALIVYGLEWFAMLCVASIAFFFSVVFRSSAAAMGTMLASLIGGTILTRLSPDWTAGKYFFVSGLPLADYYSGGVPPYDGMSLEFCVSLLAGWAIVSLVAAFVVFTRRDIFG